MSTTTPLENRRRRVELERKAAIAEERISNHVETTSQLNAVISAAELYMQALQLTNDVDDKKRLDSKTKALILRAEELKRRRDDPQNAALRVSRSRITHPCSSRQLTTRENIILLEGSKLNGALFRPWTGPPSQSEFDAQSPFEDDFNFSLAETQMKHFAGWKRSKDALALIKIEKDGQMLPNEATMDKLGQWDMVQDVAPDCSVIASFCVGTARAERGHRRIFGSIVYPYDHVADRPTLSTNGKYVMRLYFNGCWRRVEIDDRLPVSKSSRVLHVIDRSHPGLVWPALVEKAYLKVRGGYDFPGSNSGTDLAVIIGWIPQQIFLHDEDVEPQGLWDELASASAAGEIMVTLGTGKLGKREQQSLGLGAEHDYAVLDMKDNGETREVLIKNPWADGDIWKGATRCRPNPGREDENRIEGSAIHDAEEMKPGTFWMDFNRIFQYFEHMYVNWDPGLFEHREDMHFSWVLPEVMSAGSLLIDNPQFSIQANQAGEVWILLNRHFRTGDFSTANHGKNGYIGLYLFAKDGEHVFSSEGAKIRGPFVDSPNTLLRLSMTTGQRYTLVAGSQDMPSGKHNFTMSVFSHSRVILKEASQLYQPLPPILAAWTRSTAGGSSDSPNYLINPQFRLSVLSRTRACLVLKCLSDIGPSSIQPNREVHVKLLVCSSDGQRVTKLRQRDTIAHSGDYKRGSTVIETCLDRGKYTIICSTFEPKQVAKFSLQIFMVLPTGNCKLEALPSEDTGRFIVTSMPALFTGSTTKQIAPLHIPNITRAIFRASCSPRSSSSLFKMSLEQGQGPYRKCVATSAEEGAEFSSISSGLRISDTDLHGSMTRAEVGGLWLVLEKPSGQASTELRATDAIVVDVLGEERIAIGEWAILED